MTSRNILVAALFVSGHTMLVLAFNRLYDDIDYHRDFIAGGI